jgi:hypothetical protein
MQTHTNKDQAKKELKVLQEPSRNNRIRRQLPFIDFIAKRDKLGFGTKTQVKKAVSEEILGDFDNQEISDAVYCYTPFTSQPENPWG